MRKVMRKVIGVLFSIVMLLLLAAIVIPFLIPLDAYKAELVNQLSARTGREVRIDGDLRLKFLPDISIRMEGITVGNPDGFSDVPLAKIQTLDAEVALRPLLKKQIIVQRLILKKPEISLEVNKQQQPNWNIEFQTSGQVDLPNPLPAMPFIANAYAQETTEQGEGGFQLEMLSLSGLEIQDGGIRHQNAAGVVQSLADVNLTADAVAFDKPLSIKGSAVWNGEKFDIQAGASALKTIQSTKKTALKTKLQSKHLQLSFQGKVSAEDVSGNLEIGTPSLVAMTAWLKSPMDYRATRLVLAARGQLTCKLSASSCGMAEADFAIDDIRLQGKMGMNWSRAVPYINATLGTEKLDVNPYMTQAAAGVSPKWADILISPAIAEPHTGWNTAPMDWSALKAVNADILLRAAEIVIQKMQFRNNIVGVNLKGGALDTKIEKTEFQGGTLSGSFNAVTHGKSNSVALDLQAAGMDIRQLLMTLAADDRISGTGKLRLNARTAGASQADMVARLSGSGDFSVRDGAIKGINLAEMFRNVKSAFSGAESGAQQTDFTELTGSYDISGGIVSNQDLAMKSPFVRMTGKGIINLPAYTISYRLLPEVVNTSTGQDGKEKTGFVVPVIVEGALDNPQFRPDLAGVITDVLQDPQKYKQNIKEIRGNIKGELKELKQDYKTLKETIKKPETLLENPENINQLLKGFGIKSPLPQPEPQQPAPPPPADLQPPPTPAEQPPPP